MLSATQKILTCSGKVRTLNIICGVELIRVRLTATSIILLVFGVICSFAVSLSLDKLIYAYEQHCILGADVQFRSTNESAPIIAYGTSPFQDRIDRQETLDRLALNPITMTKKFVILSDFFNESYAKTLLEDYQTQLFPIEQVQRLVNSKQCFLLIHVLFAKMANYISGNIDETTTVWGQQATCDFGVYIPICQSCFGIIMATMFIICGKGGKTEPNSFLPQPWRIVTPALVFFLIMTILSVVNLVIVERGMNQFCDSFEENFNDIGCDVALNHYVGTAINLTISPSVYHKLLTSFNYTAFGIWILSLLVLLARIIFVIDFQLVRVTIKTIEYEKTNESSNLQAVQIEDGKDEAGTPLATTKC